MCGIHVLLIETDIGLAVLTGGDAGDDVGVAAASRDLPKDLLYVLNNLQLHSGDIRHSRFVDRRRYWAGGAHGRGCR